MRVERCHCLGNTGEKMALDRAKIAAPDTHDLRTDSVDLVILNCSGKLPAHVTSI